jgi:hypothetical protein
MPYRSGRQARFMEGCRASPGKMRGRCPPPKVTEEYHRAERRAKRPRRTRFADADRGR